MTKEEFKKEVLRIEQEASRKKLELYNRCAEENNPYKVGDIVEDHISKGRIRSWSLARTFSDIPCLSYFCDNLTRKGDINKREPTRYIYQSNIIKKVEE